MRKHVLHTGMLRLCALAVAAIVAACSSDSPSAPQVRPTAPPGPSLSFDQGIETSTYLVKYASAGAVSSAQASVAAVGAAVARQIGAINLLYVTGLSDAGAATLAATPGLTVVRDRLVQMVPSPTTVQRNFVKSAGNPTASGTDQSGAFFFAQYQWSLKVTRADQTWVPSNGGLGETVCVLDTGIDPTHQDIVGAVDLTKTATAILVPRFPSDVTPDDYHFHGTFVSAQIRSNGIGTASVAPNATLCAIKVLSEDGGGTFGDIIYGIFLARQFGGDVINMSLGGFIDAGNPANGPFLAFLQEVIDVVRTSGLIVVAASGNSGLNMDDIYRLINFKFIPAMMNNVVSVGATGPFQQQNFDMLAGYSNYGGQLALDLVAPGGNGGLPGGVLEDYILSACSQFAFGGACVGGNSYLFGNGTSFASPMVAGAAAVVESNVGSMTTGQLESCLRSTATYVGPGWIFGKGRLDVRAASRCSGK